MNLEKEIFDISLQDIIPNRFQPREIFNDAELTELSESIKQHGVIQPIIVRKVGDKYEIIAGERRFRASQMAGKTTIPALVRDIDDREAAKIALLENLQRSNLTPIEEAKTYQTILKIDNITQDELANNLGRSQSTIANKLRLLTLNEEVQTALLNSQISERHARSLLGLTNEQQIELLHKTINEKLTVRQLDEEVMKTTGKMPDNMNNDMPLNISEGDIIMNSQISDLGSQNISVPEVQEQNTGILNTTIPLPNQDSINENGIINIPTVDIPQAPIDNPSNENINPNIEINMNQQPENTENNVSLQVDIPQIPNVNQTQPNEISNDQLSQINTPMPNQNIEQPIVENSIENNNETLQEIVQSPEEQQKPENIFDKLRVNREENEIENKIDLKTPDLSSVISNQEENNNEISPENNYNDIYDLRFAINNFRQAVQNTEKFGFKVNTTENDNGDKYQIIIEIEKK